jgi:hypothetical protein
VRQQNLTMQTEAIARELAQSAVFYAADHKDALPESLDVLVQNGQVSPQLLISPRDPKHRRFIYKPFIPTDTGDAELPLVWEDVDADAPGLVVAFADCHAEYVTRKDFEAAMQHAQEIKAKFDAQKKRP